MNRKTVVLLLCLAVAALVVVPYTLGQPQDEPRPGGRQPGQPQDEPRSGVRQPGQPRQPGSPQEPGMPPIQPGMRYRGAFTGTHPEIERMDVMLQVIQRMRHVCFDPETSGMVALGAMKDDVPRKSEAVIKDFEDLLGKTKTLGLRNAIRIALKDLYKAQGEQEKVLDMLRAMVKENDAACQAETKEKK